MTEQSAIQKNVLFQTASQQDKTEEYLIRGRLEMLSQRINEVGFIDKGTGQHQSNTIYSDNGCCPCLNAVNHKEPIKVVTKG